MPEASRFLWAGCWVLEQARAMTHFHDFSPRPPSVRILPGSRFHGECHGECHASRPLSPQLPGPGLPALALLLGVLSVSPLQASPACSDLRQRRDGLAARAMQAEIALVMDTRQRICPAQEAAAERAHAQARALEGSQPAASATGSAGAPAPLDYQAFIRCREQAERLLRRARPVLFSNANGFFFYTATGARLARQAEVLQPQIAAGCPASTAPVAPPKASAAAGSTPTPARP